MPPGLRDAHDAPGDPPNILIGSLVDLSFNQFVINLAPICAVIMIVQAAMIHVLWGKDLKATPESQARVMSLHASSIRSF